MESSENTYFESRIDYINKLKKDGINPYPHSFKITMNFSDFIKKYNDLTSKCVHYGTNESCRHEEFKESLAGRIVLNRNASKKLAFKTLTQDGNELQFMIDFRYYQFNKDVKEEDKLNKFVEIVNNLSRGDIIGAHGFVGRSHKGELSLFPYTITLLTPCLHVLPMSHFGIKDDEMRARKRYLDLMINKESRMPFIVRNKTIKFIRKYLDDINFMEVQTPILTPQPGGASAKPFITYYNDIKMDMSLRIAPELYLKQLVVGGFDRVYELGPQFRNESRTYKHNPEFWSLEFYMTYADYNDLMKLGEDFISKLVKSVTGSYKIKYLPHASDKEIEIDFTPPFKKLDLVKEIEKGIDDVIPTPYDSDATKKFLIDVCHKFGVHCDEPKTIARLFDKLCGHFVESQCEQPTFIINHPVIMSPLAKWHRDNNQLTERFELFVNGFELCNAYTELNDSEYQKMTFEKQMKDKSEGDQEAQSIDKIFINALEYGLPPTAGFGMGIDRFVMLLANASNINDVMLFPTLRPDLA